MNGSRHEQAGELGQMDHAIGDAGGAELGPEFGGESLAAEDDSGAGGFDGGVEGAISGREGLGICQVTEGKPDDPRAVDADGGGEGIERKIGAQVGDVPAEVAQSEFAEEAWERVEIPFRGATECQRGILVGRGDDTDQVEDG